ncbi:hypothetical protein SAMN04488516_102155 [Desulfonauticus submarinus]|uniref:Uncharacterized protein n=1 Tax=Desulfonauticus submarinus TaxID=206665 RepID=A0A1H0BG99_9BACT|nr:hypothetical protein [Desulfonauticus submarinus]SDN44423.1 hypothetical protein SAMN04488516_102155 [Desulfonauticus submarinus]
MIPDHPLFYDIKRYAGSIDKPLITPEINTRNDFYGHAYILKKYSSIPENVSLKCCIEHGNPRYNANPEDLLISKYKIAIVQKKIRKIWLSDRFKCLSFAIGPYIHYADYYYKKKDLMSLKNALGKVLLVFPYHSTHWIDSYYDIIEFINKVKAIGRNFDHIVACIYWKDVLKGLHNIFYKENILCVSAGHMYDRHFLERLKSIIYIADCVVSNSLGTHFSYCCYLKKPFFYIKQDVSFVKNRYDVSDPDVSFYQNHMVKKAMSLFSKFSDKLSDIQLKFMNEWGGYDQIKTPEELKAIFEWIGFEYVNF